MLVKGGPFIQTSIKIHVEKHIKQIITSIPFGYIFKEKATF